MSFRNAGEYFEISITRKNSWILASSVTFIIMSLFSLIENSFFRVEDYFVPRSMITIAKKAVACGNGNQPEEPMPTLKLIAQNKTDTCKLFMDGSDLKQIYAEIKEFNKLEELHLASNRLKTLPKEIGDLPIKYIDLGKNQLVTVPKAVLELEKLQKLEIGFNQIRTIPGNVNKLTELRFASFNKNLIIKLPRAIGELKKLEFLELGNNRIVILPKEIGGLSNLKELYLYNNSLHKIPVEIGLLEKLEILDLRNNLLKDIPEETGNLKNLKRIELSGNNINNKVIEMLKKRLPDTKIVNIK